MNFIIPIHITYTHVTNTTGIYASIIFNTSKPQTTEQEQSLYHIKLTSKKTSMLFFDSNNENAQSIHIQTHMFKRSIHIQTETCLSQGSNYA